jgi:hypothetical protein
VHFVGRAAAAPAAASVSVSAGSCWKLRYTQCGFMLGSIKMSDFD